MEALLTSSFTAYKPVTYLNLYKGPYNNKKLGTVSFVEFGDSYTASEFVKAFEASSLTVQAQGKQLLVKRARTQKNSARNWVLRKAEELVKAVPGVSGVKLEWKERAVKVGSEDAYKQGKEDLGSFVGNFTNLKLP